MRVLHLISSAGYYGAEAVVVNLSKQLNRLGANSILGVFHNVHSPNLEVAEAARLCGVDVEIVPCRGRVDLANVRTVSELARRAKVDVIHTHGYKSHLYGYWAARHPRVSPYRGSPALSCPLIATYHGYHSRTTGSARLRQRVYAATERILLCRFDRVVAVSANLADSLRQAQVTPDRLAVITNGIDLSEFGTASPSADLEKTKAGRIAIGLVGRLTEFKGHRQLFQAAKGILAEYPKTVLFVVGDGPLRSSLEGQVRELGIESNVVFTGQRTDMAGVYAALDMFVLPSLQEGMPMTILEALAARKAIIATRVGAIPEAVLNERTGLLIEPSDVAALQKALSRLFADKELRRSLGENGAAFARDHFSAESMAGKYLSLYREALG